MVKVLLVTGYRRTGKDTLYEMMVGNKPMTWCVYHKQGADKLRLKQVLDSRSWVKASFAHHIKVMVLQDYNARYDKRYMFDDIEMIKDVMMPDGLTLRDMLISKGDEMKLIDKDYWSKLVLNNVVRDTVVTDWRFIDEATYALPLKEVTTIRLFRPEVNVPDKAIVSEHDLDCYDTDLLLVTDRTGFDEAVKLFPQYKDFEPLV